MLANVLFKRHILSCRYFAYKPRQETFKNWTIVKDDYVEVNSGKSKGKQGKVLKVNRLHNWVLVEGANYEFKEVDDDEYVKRKKTVQQESPIHISNVNLIDPESDKATRVRIKRNADGVKERISTRSGAIIPKPEREDIKYTNRTRNREVGPLDTKPEDVLEKTYKGEDFIKVKKEFEEFLRIKREKESHLVFDE